MQIAKTLLLMAALGGSVLWAQSQNVPPQQTRPSAYDEARQTYVNAALVQVQAYRKQIDAAAKTDAAEQNRYAEPNRLLKEMEVLVSRLRSAAPSEFDVVKANYERARVALDRSLGRTD
jgi:hypothetical protein